MNGEKIPFLDLYSHHMDLEHELVSAFREVVKSGRFIGGPSVEQFEKEFASFCEIPFAIGVGSGTDALRFALIASGVRQGEIVITTPNTFIATVEAISQASASVAFVDVDERTSNISPSLLREYLSINCFKDSITGETINIRNGRPVRAIVPVHLYGQMADMDEINEIAAQYNLVVIEDSCQAHGASYFSRTKNKWIKAGNISHAAAFSFYPGKNLGAFGEAGAVTTSDPVIAQTVKMLRDHGQIKKYMHDIEGYNGRLDSIQASVLSLKLRKLENWNQLRQEIASRYNELLSAIDGVIIPSEPSWSRGVYHLYVIRVKRRDELQTFLSQNGIDTGLHYPVPLHLQKAYKNLGFKEGSFPVSEMLAKEILSLPMYPALNSVQQIRVCEKIKEFVTGHIESNRQNYQE
jgi:dTDP-4-amino-4,6-dideoxygalactose transaminase